MASKREMMHLESQGHYAANLDARRDEVYDAEFEDLIRQILIRVTWVTWSSSSHTFMVRNL